MFVHVMCRFGRRFVYPWDVRRASIGCPRILHTARPRSVLSSLFGCCSHRKTASLTLGGNRSQLDGVTLDCIRLPLRSLRDSLSRQCPMMQTKVFIRVAPCPEFSMQHLRLRGKRTRDAHLNGVGQGFTGADTSECDSRVQVSGCWWRAGSMAAVMRTLNSGRG